MDAQPAVATTETRDREHLRLLAIFHYIEGGISVCFGLLGIAYAVVFFSLFTTVINHAEQRHSSNAGQGAYTETAPDSTSTSSRPRNPMSDEEKQFFRIFMGIYAGVFVVFAIAIMMLAILTIYSGRCLHQVRRRTFSLVIGCLNVPFFPFGMALGVFTIIVLSRESVRELYAREAETATA